MLPKRILIVDDEEAVLIVLKNSLKKLGAEYEVSTATDGKTALHYLQDNDFDMLVSDYRLNGMNGLHLIAAARQLQPKIQVVLMTAYGSPNLEAELKAFQPYRYLNKPLEIDAFRKVVREMLNAQPVERGGLKVFSDDSYRRTHELLNGLLSDTGARCIFLTNAEGHLVAQIGDARDLMLEQCATLVGGAIAALFEAGRLLDHDPETINFTFREGKHENLYAVNVGRDWLLTVLIEKGPYSSKLGAVWYYTRQVAVALREHLNQADRVEVLPFTQNQLDDALDQQFDDLFGEAPAQPAAAPEPTLAAAEFPAVEPFSPPLEDIFTAPVLPAETDWPAEPPSAPAKPSAGSIQQAGELLSFEDAVKAGLIQWPSMEGSIQ